MAEGVSMVSLLEQVGAPFEGDSGLRGNPLVTSLSEDSRQVEPGALFCCVEGERFDGHDYAQQAVAAGAVGLVVERPLNLDAPQAVVPDVRAVLAPLALALAGDPQKSLQIAGVTGTNGKTTTAHMLASILEADGRSTLLLGTLSGFFTTPPAVLLARKLAEGVRQGARSVVLEVSSHALEQRRVEGLRFAAGLFTNLSPDHLDYHGSMESYFEAKKRLFSPDLSRKAVVCCDDEWGRRLASEIAEASEVGGAHPHPTGGVVAETSETSEREVEVTRCSINDAEVIRSGVSSTRFRWKGMDVQMPIGGRMNVSNAVLAGEAAIALGVERQSVKAGLEQLPSVPGRFEVVAREPFTVIVDFAHSPGSLQSLLASARPLLGEGSRLNLVFGCGGDRYRGKRSAMGRIAAEGADRVFITSDNPRSEEPRKIADQIRSGVRQAAARRGFLCEVESDRRKAIARALSSASEGDVVLIAGKGHETSQAFDGESVYFSDQETAEELMSAIPEGSVSRR